MNRVRVVNPLGAVMFQAFETPGQPEVELPEFVKHGIRIRGWRLERRPMDEIPAEAREDWEPPDWREVARVLYETLSEVNAEMAEMMQSIVEASDGEISFTLEDATIEAVQAAFDRYTTAEIAQAELDPVPQEES